MDNIFLSSLVFAENSTQVKSFWDLSLNSPVVMPQSEVNKVLCSTYETGKEPTEEKVNIEVGYIL